ncbi:Citrate synthase [Frankia canadensis]|uniref:citrate synthase (unknown stereospecificity) n=1 Tax=Frankia canadensis TaxID=1836972 RepID=A0A2I2KKJ9_9ACTN|nr:citrate/2-methylcitrate synthase [Frankia canadensis]SNQ46202.1 Citrate synthase [Frankia canadensis]SOU53492.1 Citrate synthase [Frankia canadensis]
MAAEGRDPSPSAGRLTTRQVADRLGVKTETVYAYASRGLLTSERAAGGKGSTFDPVEVERLRRADRGDAGRREGRGFPQISTAITLIRDGGLYYRGRDATALAVGSTFEEVIALMWQRGDGFSVPFADSEAPVRWPGVELPGMRLPDRLRIAVPIAAAADPLRFDLGPASVAAMGARLLGDFLAALPLLGDDADDPGLAARLWPRLTAIPPTPDLLRCLEATLILLADHDLAVSSVAARVAASARAHPYAVVSAGLGALDGPLHGGASSLAYRLLIETLSAGSAAMVIADHLRSGQRVPGLGHALYPRGDPRARALLRLLGATEHGGPSVAAIDEIVTVASRDASLLPNIDGALAALAVSMGMGRYAGEAIFIIARTVGWIAHALEEYQEKPLRMRALGVYTGPDPEHR